MNQLKHSPPSQYSTKPPPAPSSIDWHLLHTTKFRSAHTDPSVRPPIALRPITNVDPCCIVGTTIIILQLIRRIVFITTAGVVPISIITNVRNAGLVNPEFVGLWWHLVSGIAPGIEAACRDSEVVDVDPVPVAIDGWIRKLTGFKRRLSGALAGQVGNLNWGANGVAVLVDMDSVVSIGEVGWDVVRGMCNARKCSQGADESCFELHSCD
jgi:hypothetical protein